MNLDRLKLKKGFYLDVLERKRDLCETSGICKHVLLTSLSIPVKSFKQTCDSTEISWHQEIAHPTARKNMKLLEICPRYDDARVIWQTTT